MVDRQVPGLEFMGVTGGGDDGEGNQTCDRAQESPKRMPALSAGQSASRKA
jgi:hypothetical protein